MTRRTIDFPANAVNQLAKIEELYYAACDVPREARDAFLRDACGGNEDLRREVESLLSLEHKAVDFIETPPGDIAAGLFSRRTSHDLIGRQLGRYRIVASLGAGGMGEVYEAEDVKLGRRLALKLLPPHFSEDAERKRRFEQEARAASALNHPNIITIYGNETAEGLDFITAELIDGQTLRQLITKSPLPWRETVDIALQIAGALDAAHSVGVIHRDIKPANIMVRPDGYVKVLDFGLAKLSNDSTVAALGETRDQTDANRVMGTINYMSPEQALGKKVDARSDIFSLGAVMFEMLAGDAPFNGLSEAAIYNSILNQSPASIREKRSEIPPALEQIIAHALEKNRDERYQSAAELRRDLEALRQNSSLGLTFAKPKRRSMLSLGRVVSAVVVIAIAAAAAWFAIRPQKSASPVKNYNYTQLTSAAAEELFPAIAPDGETFVYSSRESGNWDIFYRKRADSAAVNLTKDSPADDKQPAFSFDGTKIAFRSQRDGGGIFIMNADGSDVRKVVDGGFFPAFSPDGREISYCVDDFPEPGNRTFVPSSLMAVDLATGATRVVTDTDAVQPNWSPNGHRIAFWGLRSGGQRDVLTVDARGGTPVPITLDAPIDWNPVWSPDGKYLYFVSDRSGSMNLWRVPIDERSGAVKGELEALTIPSKYSHSFTFANDGKSFVYVQSSRNTNILSIGFDPVAGRTTGSPTEVNSGAKIATNPDVSPDGKQVLFDSIGGLKENVSVMNADGSGIRSLTNESFKDRTPRWSADGKHIAFFSNRTGRYEGYVMNADGGNLRQIGDFSNLMPAQMPTWSPNPLRLLLNTSNSFPVIIDLNPDMTVKSSEVISAENAPCPWFMAFSWSPDGRFLVGYGRNPNESASKIVTYDIASKSFSPRIAEGNCPIWLADSKRILFVSGQKIFLHDISSGKTKEILNFPGDGVQSISISRDNKTLYYAVRRNESDIWIATEQ